MSRTMSDMKDSLKDVFQGNGNLFTVSAVVLIIICGVSLVDNRSNWWITPVAVGAFLLMVFLFLNARVVVKSILTSVLVILLAAGGFKVGVYTDTRGTAGLLWMGGTFFLFFALLSYSYYVHSPRSRWGVLFLSELEFFGLMYVILVLGLNPVLTTVISLVVASGTFVLLYQVLPRLLMHRSSMPRNVLTDKDMMKISSIFEKDGWNVRLLPRKNDEGGLLVWKDSVCYLHPVVMDTPFGDKGRRHQRISYNGRSINSWLLDLSYNVSPVSRAGGAAVTTILLDMKDRNGSESKILGVSGPDTTRVLPVCIVPSRNLSEKLPERIEKVMERVSSAPLTARDISMLDRIGFSPDSVDDQ